MNCKIWQVLIGTKKTCFALFFHCHWFRCKAFSGWMAVNSAFGGPKACSGCHHLGPRCAKPTGKILKAIERQRQLRKTWLYCNHTLWPCQRWFHIFKHIQSTLNMCLSQISWRDSLISHHLDDLNCIYIYCILVFCIWISIVYLPFYLLPLLFSSHCLILCIYFNSVSSKSMASSGPTIYIYTFFRPKFQGTSPQHIALWCRISILGSWNSHWLHQGYHP